MRTFVFILTFFIIKCDGIDTDFCNPTPKDIYGNNVTLPGYCEKKPCIPKCCEVGKMLYYNKTLNNLQCLDFKKISMALNFTVSPDYSDLNIYKREKDSNEKVKSSMMFNDFSVIVNQVYLNGTCGIFIATNCKIFEDGEMAYVLPNRYNLYNYLSPSDYCVDRNTHIINNTAVSKYICYIGAGPTDEVSINEKKYFNGIGRLISALFLFMTLIVFCLLKKLRDNQGIVLMAYVTMLMVALILNAYSILVSDYFTKDMCTDVSAAYYFFFISSFFWLTVVSFETWIIYTNSDKLSALDRPMDLRKFMHYALYAWGTPLIMTIAAAVIDKVDVPANIVKIHFSSCLSYAMEYSLYMYIPITILIIVNTLLVVRPIYKVYIRKWTSRETYAVQESLEADQARLKLCIHLALYNLVSWCFQIYEILNSDIPHWLYFVLNVTHDIIGITLFVMIVCRKFVFYMLCETFNIEIAGNSETRQTGEELEARNRLTQ